ncbi:ATP-binding protein [Williamwhitmania taraxaci]|uniref:histidine kinase n=1 Tax=Williamwhitmania taraxaci TaxID=1640674 RepID=A0A1G6ST01_9BACT|nr:ATP-binding protein [Williamwhitmania taraxaci]SDD19356.1 PAS domain S-box-containing protein [Williamwhitmania taraxaci]
MVSGKFFRVICFVAQLGFVLVVDVIAAPIVAEASSDSGYVYKVGLPNVPGVMYRCADGTPGGFSVELVQHLLDDEHIRYVWVDGSWADLFEKVKKGEIDILPGTQVSAERKAHLDFLSNRFYTMWSELYVGKHVKFHGLNDLRGKRIGLIRNDNNGIGFVNYVAEFQLEFTPVSYESHKDAVEALIRNEIYAVAGPSPSLFGAMLNDVQSAGIFFNPTDLNIGFTKGKHKAIMAKMNRRLIQYMGSETSIYAKLLSKYGLVNVSKTWQHIPLWLTIFLYSLVGAFFIVAVFVLILRIQVSRKTLQLREKEFLMAKVLDLGEMGVWGFDVATQNYFWSKEIYAMTGYSMEDISDLNNHIIGSFHPDDRANVLTALARTIATGANMDVEFRATSKNGGYVFLRVIGTVAMDKVGKPQRVLGICHNVTNQKNYESTLLGALSKAEESERLKSAFLANVSHEIRTPLNAIVGFSSLLAENQMKEEKRLIYSNVIVSQSNTLLTLINDIIDLAKIEAGVMSIHADFEVRAQSFLTDVYASHKLLCPEHINLILSIPPECKKLSIKVDEIRVRQILNNFVTNAFKYADPGDVILGVKLDDERQRIELYVKDSGPGIDPLQHSSIFNRFYKLNQFSQGPGLGLSIAKSLADLLGGEVSLRSAVGEGSEFVLSIKL